MRWFRREHPSDFTNQARRLEPASAAVPATSKNEKYEDDDDQKRRVVHVVLLWSVIPLALKRIVGEAL